MDFDPAELLAKPLMAHLATSSPDGPRDSPVWFLWEDEAIWLIGNSDDSFPVRLRGEPRCALGIVEFDVAQGILRHVGIRGVASIFAMDHTRLHRLLERYLGREPGEWNKWFTANIVKPLDLMIQIKPLSTIARDICPTSGPGLIWPRGPSFATILGTVSLINSKSKILLDDRLGLRWPMRPAGSAGRFAG